MQKEDIIERVKTLHPDSTIDIAGEDCSFEITISKGFIGQNTLQRQKQTWLFTRTTSVQETYTP